MPHDVIEENGVEKIALYRDVKDEKSYYVEEEDGKKFVGMAQFDIDKKTAVERKMYLNLENIDEKSYDKVKDQMLQRFLKHGNAQTQEDLINELSSLDLDESKEFVKKLEYLKENDPLEYDRQLRERNVYSNEFIKRKTYGDLRANNKYAVKKALFETDSVIDNLMYQENPEFLKDLSPSEITLLQEHQRKGIEMKTTQLTGSKRTIDLATKKTPFTPMMLMNFLYDEFGSADAVENFLKSSITKEEMVHLSKKFADTVQRPPLYILMREIADESKQKFVENVANHSISQLKANGFTKEDPEYKEEIKRVQEFCQRLLDDDEYLKNNMETSFIRGKSLFDEDVDSVLDKDNIDILNLYFEKFDNFDKDLRDLEANPFVFGDNYRKVTRTNLKLNECVLEMFLMTGINFHTVFKQYYKRKEAKKLREMKNTPKDKEAIDKSKYEEDFIYDEIF